MVASGGARAVSAAHIMAAKIAVALRPRACPWAGWGELQVAVNESPGYAQTSPERYDVRHPSIGKVIHT